MLALVAAVAFLFLLPSPWNWVGFAAALVWEVSSILWALWWSKRLTLLVGTGTLVGRGAVVIEPCTPKGRVRLGGETWQARSLAPAERGTRVRILSVEGLTLHVEPEAAG